MTNKTTIDLINFVERALKENWGYVWGAGGEVYTNEVAKKLHKTYGTAKYNAQYYLNTQMKRWGGKRVADCSGLIQAFRGTDDTADGLYNKCTIKGSLKSFKGDMGYLVFCRKDGFVNHVGVMVGSGYVIHSTNSEKGVIKERLSTSKRGWTHYGKPVWLEQTYITPTKAIKMGSSIADISWLQSNLNRVMAAGLVVDGIHGPKTAKAVLNYRKKVNDWKPEYIGLEVPLRIIKKLGAE